MTTTRDAFEAWAASIHIDTVKDQDAWGNRIYKHAHVDSMWFSWQAATAAERIRCEMIALNGQTVLDVIRQIQER